MSKQNGEVRLPKPFEMQLTKWPEPERDEGFWDDNAEKIGDRLESAKAESASHRALLEAPLPAEPGEGSLGEPAAAAEEPAPRSLLELARMSLESDQKADSSDIAKESLSLASRARVSAPMLAEAHRTQAANVAAQMLATPPPPSVSEPVAPASIPVASAQAPVMSAPPAPVRAKRSAAGPLVMAGLGLVGLAAAAMIVVRAQRQEAAPVAMAPPAAAPAASAAATAEPPKAPADDIVELGDLGSGKVASADGVPAKPGAAKEEKVAGAKGGKPEAPSAPTAVAEKTPEPAPAAKPETKPAEKDEEGAKMKPAATAGDIPDKPSTGAVQAAIGSVMGGARACVAGQDSASRATVSFGSDGRVQSVSVSGPAAGTPAEACIKAALSKARVQAFARPSFSVGVTVRP